MDQQWLLNQKNYTFSSSRRIATPAYGGVDVDRREESIAGIKILQSGRGVSIQLKSKLRKDFVYELHLNSKLATGKKLFPAEAYYTLRQIP